MFALIIKDFNPDRLKEMPFSNHKTKFRNAIKQTFKEIANCKGFHGTRRIDLLKLFKHNPNYELPKV